MCQSELIHIDSSTSTRSYLRSSKHSRYVLIFAQKNVESSMKFVIRSLLFVNLLLQMTNSIRKCFNQDQNIMLNIILLAFSLIGIIGLTISNRFVLIIFAACMTLILIASITIYAIGRTEEDVRRPKVPYYTTNLAGDAEQTSRAEHPTRQTGRVASSRWRQQPASSRAAKTRGPKGTTRGDRRPVQVNSSNSQLSMLLDSYSLEEFADEPTTSIDPIGKLLIAGKPIISDEINTLDTVSASLRSSEQLRKEQEDPLIELQDSPDRIQSDKWIAYERYLYQKYLDILSQSIDLIMHTILGSWLALLLDEDSDQCFGVVGGSSSERATRGKDDANRSSRRYSVDTGARNSQAIYNYNGVRYSIRPDTANEPPTRVVVR